MAHAYPLPRRRVIVLLCVATNLVTTTIAQSTTYYFSGAVQISSSSSSGTYSPAVAAQCPADHPTSCTNLNEADYCCPSGNTCAWSNSQVACCPSGQTCSGSVGGVGGYQASSYYQTTYVAPTTQYVQASTVYQTNAVVTTVVTGGGGVVVPAGYTQVTTVQTVQTVQSQASIVNGVYCSTLIANGPNLPTTVAGNCGTVLVVAPSEGYRIGVGWVKLGIVLTGLQLMGAGLFVRR